jgi:hypothetical protein
MLSPASQEGALVRRREGHMVAGGRGHGAEASSSRAGHSAQVEGVPDDPPAFADAQVEQELWGELRSHGATLNRALNEALRVHGGPAWHVFQVGRRCSFSSSSRFLRVVSVSGRLRVLTCGRQELERRARDKYGAFDRVNAELHQVRERCGAFDVLADALRTPDGWLAYRATVPLVNSPRARGKTRRIALASSESAQPSSTVMRRCGRHARTWRRCGRW